MSAVDSPPSSGSQNELHRYVDSASALENAQSQIEALEQTEAVKDFHNQMELLRRRLLQQPGAFRDMFIADGTNAVVVLQEPRAWRRRK